MFLSSAPGKTNQQSCQTTREKEQPPEVHLLDSLPPGFVVATSRIWPRPIRERRTDQCDGFHNDRNVVDPSPRGVGVQRVPQG